MSGNIRDLFDNQAELDDDEDDESFDEETGETTRRKPRKEGRVEDSSEEEDDDDDEEEARRIREGFIVDEDEDEEEGEDEENRERRKKKKRRRAERDDEEKLDEEDLDLIGEAIPSWERNKETAQSKFKRLKRGHRDEDKAPVRRGLAEIFSDEDDEVADDRGYGRPSNRAQADEFDDFIEEDFPEDEEERNQRMEDMEVARAKGLAGTIVDAAGLDKDALDDMERIFGTGEEYDWALQLEDEEEDRERDEQVIELKDVFEPSQLADKLLTDEDNEIRFTDEPERFQIERRPFKNVQLTGEQFKEEGRWITNLIWPKKALAKDLEIPFTKAVSKILEFFVIDGVEVPYIFQHRRDYLIYDRKNKRDRRDYDDGADFGQEAEKLLIQDDLWRILELDIKFRSFIEKRNMLEKTWDNLKAVAGIHDPVMDEMIPKTEIMEELQDLQDYLNFQYSTQIKEINAASNGEHKELRRPGAKSGLYDRIRRSNAYKFVKAYGISADRLARNAAREGAKTTSDDDAKRPDELADSLADGDFLTADSVISAARNMYAEELFVSPRMRKYFRTTYYEYGEVSCRRTEKGLRRIDESHPFYEIKYLIRQPIREFVTNPEIFLKMMKAEEEGLIELQVTLEHEREFRRSLYTEFASDNFSELADAWNEERQKVLDLAFSRLEKVITKGLKDSLRTACQDDLLLKCRKEYFQRLDQAPYKPKGLDLGTIPRVLAMSNGMGDLNRDGVDWVYMDENGRVLEHGRFTKLAHDADQRDKFEEIVRRREPDVIGVSGFSADTHRLIKDLNDLVSEKNLTGPVYKDPDEDDDRVEGLEVIVVNDEVARLYKDNPRAVAEHPTLPPLTRYCIALAKYMQNPLKEYAALGKDVISLSIHPNQSLLPQDKLYKAMETAMVDMVNLCGVDINEAISDPYTAHLLPYIAGLGPRKATMVIKGINQNGGVIMSRDELVGDPDLGKLPVVGPRVWNNCAGFLIIPWDKSNPQSDPLDGTRIHPEDYDLARKVAADALGLDEEDVKAETDENGVAAIVRKMMIDREEDRVNELILEEYADQLLQNYQQRKRATLETIRAELQNAFEELRKNFSPPTADQIFTMLTGETRDTLCEGMIVPVYTRLVKDEFAVVKLDCGIEGRIEAHEVSHRASIKDVLHVGQTVQAKLIEVNRKDFNAKLTMREEEMRRPYKKHIDRPRGAWDYKQEDIDREELREKDKVTGRTQRVINHPLFKPFNSTQAEEFLGGQAPGEVVIRPSSKGNDHLAITWKVADGVYQHVDVLELQKDNEFSVGKILKVGGKYTYSDLDELIVDHIKAMAKKVDELIQHEKFQKGSRAECENWLNTYMAANPNRSTYAFCIDTKRAGYFWLCFKASKNSQVFGWPVRVIPHAYELQKNQYPDVRSLCNGFKLRYQNEQLRMQQMGGGR